MVAPERRARPGPRAMTSARRTLIVRRSNAWSRLVRKPSARAAPTDFATVPRARILRLRRALRTTRVVAGATRTVRPSSRAYRFLALFSSAPAFHPVGTAAWPIVVDPTLTVRRCPTAPARPRTRVSAATDLVGPTRTARRDRAASAWWTSSTVPASCRSYSVVTRMIRAARTPTARARPPRSVRPGPVSRVPVASTSPLHLLDRSGAARGSEELLTLRRAARSGPCVRRRRLFRRACRRCTGHGRGVPWAR
jgi:hypothetical protein